MTFKTLSKAILAEFYKSGLQIIQEQKTEKDYCPLCLTPYAWSKLTAEISDRNKRLNFDVIQALHKKVETQWRLIRQHILSKNSDLTNIDISSVRDIYAQVKNLSSVDAGISLGTFSPDDVSAWAVKAQELIKVLGESYEAVKEELIDVEKSLNENPEFGLQTTIDTLFEFWKSLDDIKSKSDALAKATKRLDVTNQIVDALRSMVSSFRSELSDFSGRVVGIINSDVKAYYDELHPKDDVRPYLDVSVSGNQRIVNLKCDYKGVPNKTAVSLLSESHRNSLGMSILLAFMKYKRHAGSPVGFCVFDDVTQSFDVEHRTNLLNFLENKKFPEISDQQILFFTHDRTLADLIKRSGDQQERENWLRVDIRHWWLERMLLEAENDAEPLTRAEHYINNNQ